jgi:hypothetical protein
MMNRPRYGNVMRVDEEMRGAIDCPAPDDVFVEQLRVRLDRKATAMQEAATPGRLRRRRVWAFALGTIAILLVALTVSVPSVATAMERAIRGYIAGIGLIEVNPGLRILSEPVTLTREGFTIEVDRAILSDDQTVIHYRAESTGAYPFAEPGAGEDVCLDYAHLRLPDGTVLQPQPMGTGKAFGTGYEFATSFSAPIPLDVTQATLVIPCLLDSSRGSAPEQWELALGFVAAPPDMDLNPVQDAATSQHVRDRGLSMNLESVVSEGGDYVFDFHLNWERRTESPQLYPTSIYVTDAVGNSMPLIDDFGRPPMPHDTPQSFLFRTEGEVVASGPLTLTIDAIRATWYPRDAFFAFDPGDDPQPNQVWSLNEAICVGGYTWTVTAARMVVQEGREGFEFMMEPEGLEAGMSVQLLDRDHPGIPGTGEQKGASFSSTFIYEGGIPEGPITVAASRVDVSIPGHWQVAWTPFVR